jgi:hypothetical protein
MRVGSIRRRSALGVAAGGVLAGHWLTYALVDTNAHQRTAELASTGHAYLGLANDLSLVAALVALSVVFLGGLTRRRDAGPLLRTLTMRLAIFQVVAFVCMELLERLSAGAPLAGAMHHGILPVGVVIQIGVAGLAALAISWLLRVAERIETALGSAPALFDGAGALVVLPAFHTPARRARSASGIRGPPLLASPR